MNKFKRISTVLIACLMVACGGGGGSPGETNEPYTIDIRTEKAVLPVNVGGYPAGIGVYAPFTTILYVEAKKGSAPIPGGEDIFACNTAYGLGSGPLYYLDGNDEHEDDNGNPLAYRSVTLGANSGGNSFHFHAGDEAGTAVITCSVNDPASGRQVSKSISITVGSATGRAASIKTVSQFASLGTQGNQANERTATAIQAFVLDDSNQSVPGSASSNLQVAIAAGGASSGARLLAGSQSGSVVRIGTTGGVGTFTLSSGSSEGTILLELTADRFDGDVANGIQDPIVQLLAVPVTTGVTTTPPVPVVVTAGTPPGATNGLPYSYAFGATGGVAPYTWTALGGLPEGLSLSAAGILSGTPAVRLIGTHVIAVRVTDSKGTFANANFSLAVAGTAAEDPGTNVLAITSAGCGSDLCQLTAANPPVAAPAADLYHQYVLTVTGPGAGGAVWTATGLPSWMRLSADGTLAISWAAADAPAPRVEDCSSASFVIKAARGGRTAERTVVMKVGTGAGTCKL